jgi:hypothetical protein
MQHYGVDTPSKDFEAKYCRDHRDILYLANSGELSAMFVLGYSANEDVEDMLEDLEDQNIALVVNTNDPNVNAEKICRLYDFPMEDIRIVPAQAREALSRGLTSFTHLFNTMPPLHHREGGPVSVALTEGGYAELIVDGVHVSPEMVALAYRNKKQQLVLITDSMEATDCADGEYSIAGMPVTVKNGRAMTHDGAIAGSTLHLLDGVKNLAAFANIPFEQALYSATAAPAKAMGLDAEIGSLECGKRSDMLLLDTDLNVTDVWCGGKKMQL